VRKPKVENKYNLFPKDIKNLIVADRTKICKPLFWRNPIINAWCISRSIGSDDDRRYGTDNSVWIGIYDKPYYNKYIHYHCSCWGDMGNYEFKKFFDYSEIENELDLETQESLLETINQLLDEGILKQPTKEQL
jgi:hypothetical protein